MGNNDRHENGTSRKGHFPNVLVLACLSLSCNFQEALATTVPDSMRLVKGGPYPILYVSSEGDREGRTGSFRLDVAPVTNSRFLAFVEANPQWRRSRVKPLFADSGYLSHWESDLVLGSGTMAEAPVTRVSWFAARAYCRDQGKRLATVAEWERAAAAGKDDPLAWRKPGHTARILQWYGRPTGRLSAVMQKEPNFWGLHDMHGLVWEWTADFNSVLVGGDSRGGGDLDRNLFCGSAASGAVDPADYASFMRYAFRSSLKAGYTVSNLGFRCAGDE